MFASSLSRKIRNNQTCGSSRVAHLHICAQEVLFLDLIPKVEGVATKELILLLRIKPRLEVLSSFLSDDLYIEGKDGSMTI